MSTMPKNSVHTDANEAVSSSRADEMELVDAISRTAAKHILRLQVPTSIHSVTVSFEPKSHGPVTIEFSLTAALPELTVITDPSHTAGAHTRLVTDCPNISNEVKLDSAADTNLSASMGPLHMDTSSTGCTADSTPAGDNHVKSASVQPALPCVLVVNDNEIEPESEEGTPRPVEKIASEPLPSPLPARTPQWSLKRGFTPDSFAASEEFDSVDTQFLRETWAQIREDLVTGQECRKPIFSEVTTPTPPPDGTIDSPRLETGGICPMKSLFVLTFFLAEQRNGYFVLNDIFRFLKGTTAKDDVSETDAATLVDQPSSSPEQPAAEPQFYTLLPPTANAASTMVRVNISFSCRIVGLVLWLYTPQGLIVSRFPHEYLVYETKIVELQHRLLTTTTEDDPTRYISKMAKNLTV
ncbi:hypothetical protein EDD15DRAFT_2193414 [Pisolithus albus]|nr:hypothetical protein EDD15DRAFT_2193414 [Pisolithus albus]